MSGGQSKHSRMHALAMIQPVDPGMTDYVTQSHEVEAVGLGVTAFEHLTETLTKRGNNLSGIHVVALLKLVELLAGYVAGTEFGRKAFPLPTGMGKTTGVVSFIVALHRLGYRVPVAVAASQVQALVTLKRELMAAGVPEADIGLAHRDRHAGEPSTGCSPEDGRLFQLVTHARVRMDEAYLGLFAQYHGRPRPLLVYDETLFRSDSFAFLSSMLGSATHGFGYLAKGRDDLEQVSKFLLDAVAAIDQALDQAAHDGSGKGQPLELPEVLPDVLDHWKALLGTVRMTAGNLEVLRQFLDVCQMPLQALPMSQGGGAVAVRQAVSDQLANVVVLDASTPIRDLVSLDSTMQVYEPIPADLKSFERVEVMQLLAAGGRSSIEQRVGDKKDETSTVSREVVDIIKDELAADPTKCMLVFTFKRSTRSDLDIKQRLVAALKLAGIDPDEPVSVPGKDSPVSRIAFLHWGQHEGLNGYEHCQTVILAGVLHRAHLDIAANIKGQKLDLEAPTPHALVSKVIKSEIAHCVYQAASRGSCRRVTDGKANAMRLWLIHLDAGLKDSLDKVMPKAQWSYPTPRHIKVCASSAAEVTMPGRILEALGGLAPGMTKISVQALKKAMALETGKTTKDAFTKGINGLDLTAHGWARDDRSLVRATAAAYGFVPA